MRQMEESVDWGRFENDTAQTTQINFTGQHRCLANQNLNYQTMVKL